MSNSQGMQEVRALFRYFMGFMGMEKTQVPESIIIDIVLAIENLVSVNTNYNLIEEDAYQDILDSGWLEYGIMETNGGEEVLRCSTEFENSINAIKPLFKRLNIEEAYFSTSSGINLIFLKYNDGKARKILTPIVLQYLYDEFLGQGREENRLRAEKLREFIEKGVEGTENGYTESDSVDTLPYDRLHDLLRAVE